MRLFSSAISTRVMKLNLKRKMSLEGFAAKSIEKICYVVIKHYDNLSKPVSSALVGLAFQTRSTWTGGVYCSIAKCTCQGRNTGT